MKKQIFNCFTLFTLFASLTVISITAQGQLNDTNLIDELDPTAENIENVLKQMDLEYYLETGKWPFLLPTYFEAPSCQKFDCPVYVLVDKGEQSLSLYIHGSLVHTWSVSTGAPKSETPPWEGHPNGRIYDAYTSKKNPGGDYKGLGNMPYAVFLHGGYAIHGTTEANFKKLGTKASHGCVRVHPDHGKIFNRLVRQYGVAATWVSIVE